MEHLSDWVFTAGVILVLVGMVGVFLTGTVPQGWRRPLGRAGAVCLVAGVVCGVCAFAMIGS